MKFKFFGKTKSYKSALMRLSGSFPHMKPVLHLIHYSGIPKRDGVYLIIHNNRKRDVVYCIHDNFYEVMNSYDIEQILYAENQVKFRYNTLLNIDDRFLTEEAKLLKYRCLQFSHQSKDIYQIDSIKERLFWKVAMNKRKEKYTQTINAHNL